MQINLLTDYRGVCTEETYYTAGQYTIPDDMPEAYAAKLIDNGRAVVIDGEVPRPDSQNIEVNLKVKKDSPQLELLDTKTLRALAKAEGIFITWNMKRETILERLRELD